MRKIVWEEVEESKGFESPGAGDYVLRVVSVEDVPKSEYAWFVIDIAEGDFAGEFSRDFYDGKPYAHRMLLSYKDTALGMLKRTMGYFNASNPGFDAMAAWNGDLSMFVGRLIGAGVGTEQRESKATGDEYTALDFFNANLGTVDDARAGAIKVPEPVMLEKDEPEQAPAPQEDYSDIPFM